jgi:tetratricopeptide (TPR) repeat protein
LQQQYSCIKFFSGISNSPLGGWSKLQDIFNECIVVNDFNLKKLVTSIKIEPSQNEEYYEKALKYLTLYKNEPECKINMAKAYIELGNIYLAKEDTGKAIDCYGEAIDVYPQDPEIYQKLGQIFDKAGCYQQAIECYKAINHATIVLDCYDKWIAKHENDVASARKLGDRVVEKDVASALVDLAIAKGDYCKSVGLYEKAKEAYHQVQLLN